MKRINVHFLLHLIMMSPIHSDESSRSDEAFILAQGKMLMIIDIDPTHQLILIVLTGRKNIQLYPGVIRWTSERN